jgi:hypothetical protein
LEREYKSSGVSPCGTPKRRMIKEWDVTQNRARITKKPGQSILENREEISRQNLDQRSICY